MISGHVKLGAETVICAMKPDSPEMIKRKHPLARITPRYLHECLTCRTWEHVRHIGTKKSGGFWKEVISGG